MTDENPAYTKLGKEFDGHGTVVHVAFALRLPSFISSCGFGGDVRARRSASFMRRF
jgi:hypothetical protein